MGHEGQPDRPALRARGRDGLRRLRHVGNDDMAAFQAACTTLYRIHHPEASLNEARRLVSPSGSTITWCKAHAAQPPRCPCDWQGPAVARQAA